MNNDVAIQVKNLSKKYFLQSPIVKEDGSKTNELCALKNINFDIKKGESVGIIGPNGSGKSTLLKILAGVTKPTSGEVEINGRVCSILDIGSGFHPELSGRENVFLNGQILGFPRKEIRSAFEEIVNFSGIGKFIDEPVKNYSNGMYLRLAFSIIVHLNFDIYLFDEILTVGDADFMLKSKAKVYDLLNSNKTIILVSHDLSSLQHSNRFLLLEQGILKNDSRNSQALNDYSENIVQKNLSVQTNNIEINQFHSNSLSPELKVTKVKFYQKHDIDKNTFYTNFPFVFEIEYHKLQEFNTLDLVLNISDSMGETIFSTSPFISGSFSDKTASGNYFLRCEFPEYFFNSQIYTISAFFLLNTKAILNDKKSDLLIENYYENQEMKVTLSMQDLIIFKCIFMKEGKRFDFSDLNLKGNLLPALSWTNF